MTLFSVRYRQQLYPGSSGSVSSSLGSEDMLGLFLKAKKLSQSSRRRKVWLEFYDGEINQTLELPELFRALSVGKK